VYETRRQSFKQRRDYLVPALKTLGFDIPVSPDGAFYVFAAINKYSNNSTEFCLHMLEQAGVAAILGTDFGTAHADSTIRFAYTTGFDRLQEAVHRLTGFLS